MPYLSTSEIPGAPRLYYEDHGQGKPVILIHGWPLSHRSWDAQLPALIGAGYRVIAYDRRGFGRSEPVWNQYDYDSLTGDLAMLIDQLGLTEVTLVGFSMGGGEVVRYLTRFGAGKIAKAALISSIIPIVPETPDNPDGVPQKDLDAITTALKTDRVAFLQDFHKNFYNYSMLHHTVSSARLDADFMVSSAASDNATLECAAAWSTTDFRPELQHVVVPTLIVHGDADKIVPIDTAAEQAAAGIADNEYYVIDGAPHGLNCTHSEDLNRLLLNFLAK